VGFDVLIEVYLTAEGHDAAGTFEGPFMCMHCPDVVLQPPFLNVGLVAEITLSRAAL